MLDVFIKILPIMLFAIFSMIALVLVIEYKHKLIKSIIITVIFMCVLLAINYFLYYFLGQYLDMNLFFILTLLIPQSIFMQIMGKLHLISLSVATTNIYVNIYLIFVVKNILCSRYNNQIIEYAIYFILFILIGIYLRLFYKKLHNDIEKYTPNYLPVFGAYSLIIFIIISLYRSMISEITSSGLLRLDMFAFAIISAYTFSLMFFSLIFRNFKSIMIQSFDNNVIEQHCRRIEVANDIREQKDEELKIIRHDIKHILTATNSLIKANKLDEAIDFINNYISIIEDNTTLQYCKDPIINSVIDYYAKKCEENNINLKIKINDIESAIHISNYKIAILLSNCLENAYNAVLKMTIDRTINLTFLNNDNRLALKITNTFDGNISYDENGLPTNSEVGHGIGTSSIRKIAEENKLLLSYDINDETFTIKILF